jgi:dienelactone hydrolase
MTTTIQLNTDGLVGTLVYPDDKAPHPAVLCVGGSSGGVSLEMAEPLAQAGFAALALGYFGAPGLPRDFAELPVDYFMKAVDWLLDQPSVKGSTVGVTGTSRGSEAALQLAALSPKIGAVVAYVPSGIRWNGINGRAPWTYLGKDMPYVQRLTEFGEQTGGAVAKVDMYNKVLDDPRSCANATIEIEKATCPILLVSGKNDQLWPSERMANLVIEHLKDHHYAYPYRHITYPNAGHRIKVPGLADGRYEPTSEDTVTHEILSLGGTLEGNRAASEQSFVEMVKFFREEL